MPTINTVALLKGTGYWGEVNENLAFKDEWERSNKCENNCNSKGICIHGTCHCQPNYGGEICSNKDRSHISCVNETFLNPDNVCIDKLI